MQAIKFCVLLLVLPLLQAELVQVIQLARHGARTPNSFELISNQYPEEEGQLTVLGLVQEYFLGREMRKRYVEDLKFLPETFNSSEVLIRSSWKNRTIRSAFAFANGLYPQEGGIVYDNIYAEGFPTEQLLPLKNKQNPISTDDIRSVKIDEEWARESIEIIEMDGDLHFHAVKDDNCPPAEKIIKELKKSSVNKEIEKHLGLVLYPQLASIVNNHLGFERIQAEEMNLKKAKSVLDNYRCNSFHGKDHPEIDEYTLQILKKSRYYYVYKLMLLDDLVRSVSATKLLSEFLDYTRAARDGVPNTPKYIFYSAHDTNLEILLSVFLLESQIEMEEHYNIIPFSSVLSFEIHKEKETPQSEETYYVKLLFNDEPQFIKWCLGYKCSLDQFHKILEHYMVPALDEFCNAGWAVTKTNAEMCTDNSVC